MDYLQLNETNATLNNTEEDVHHTKMLDKYLIASIYGLIFLVGTVGNGALVYFFIRYPLMRSPPNTYILSLAIGDLFVLFFTVPFVTTIFVTDSWPFGLVICKISEVAKDLSINVTVITLTVLSAERYLAIVDPFNRRDWSNISATSVIIGIWLLSFVLAMPSACTADIRLYTNNTVLVCTPYPEWMGETYPMVKIIINMLVLYALPLIIISFFYCMMAWHLYVSTTDFQGDVRQPRLTKSQAAARRKVAKMVLAFVVIFAVCFLPNHVYVIWWYYNPNSEYDFNYFWYLFRIVGFCLTFVNSSINPVAMYCISGTFRKYYNRHLFCDICGSGEQGESLFRSRYPSSAAIVLSSTKTDQLDMSTVNGPDIPNYISNRATESNAEPEPTKKPWLMIHL